MRSLDCRLGRRLRNRFGARLGGGLRGCFRGRLRRWFGRWFGDRFGACLGCRFDGRPADGQRLSRGGCRSRSLFRACLFGRNLAHMRLLAAAVIPARLAAEVQPGRFHAPRIVASLGRGSRAASQVLRGVGARACTTRVARTFCTGLREPTALHSFQATQACRPCRKMSCGRSMPMKTILLVFFSPGIQRGPRSLPINWWTPWKITLRSVPFMFSTPL